MNRRVTEAKDKAVFSRHFYLENAENKKDSSDRKNLFCEEVYK
jgi:hypothetical protein